MSRSTTTVIRDFGGGLNVVDDDLNLSSSFQPILDNVHRGVDNTLSVRWGTELFVDLRLGSVSPEAFEGFTANWTIGKRFITITWATNGGLHGLQNGDHITFTTQWTVTTGLIPAEVFNRPLGVRVLTPSQFVVTIKTAATATGVDNSNGSVIKDTHFLAGDIIDITYYSDHLVVVDNVGEIVKINAAMQITRIWDDSIAFGKTINTPAESPPGWTHGIEYATSAIYQGRLIYVNGKDKPLEIVFGKVPTAPDCEYLHDGGSNVFVPVCKYVVAIDRWLVMAGDPVTPYKIHISASDTSNTWESAAGVHDATHLNLNNTNSSSTFIRGINKFRDLLAVAFDDTVAMVQLGIFSTTTTTTTHNPEVTDSVARHGAIAHKSMAFLGFDLIMADPIGIPTFAKSQFDNTIIPNRMSEFISPLIQRNVGRLAPDTLDKKVFNVFSTHDSRYILFMPNYDSIETRLPKDPLYFLAELMGTDRVLLHVPNHGMEEEDEFTLSGIVTSPVTLPSLYKVDTVVSEDIISFKLDAPNIVISAENTGGSNVLIKKLKTETTAYALTYNKGLKIKAWSRYKGWDFNAGCTTLFGRVFLASNSRIWRMGNRFDPIFADYINNYDVRWAASTAYTIGQKVFDVATRETYTCKIAHTSGVTFVGDRETFVDNWEIYKGEPIEFAVEFPWADFDKRDMTKIMKTINVDAKGRERFTVQMFLDYYYKHKLTGVRVPLLSMDMVGGDEGGFGVADQSYGAGRLATRQRTWPFQARGKLFKMRLQGFAREPLRFIAFVFSYKLVGRTR